MECPKCNASMIERAVEVLHGTVLIDQCSNCKGLWFDHGEAEQLKDSWMSDFLDNGDPSVGESYNRVRDIPCPRCGKQMDKLTDPKQKHIEYEGCAEHGMFFDAGEFTDYKHETLMDVFRGVIARIKR
jgi:Zn-finger nucleic acid-binding protein